jgi:hypothetical protein
VRSKLGSIRYGVVGPEQASLVSGFLGVKQERGTHDGAMLADYLDRTFSRNTAGIKTVTL